MVLKTVRKSQSFFISSLIIFTILEYGKNDYPYYRYFYEGVTPFQYYEIFPTLY